MNKLYDRINFTNNQAPALNDTNLNRMSQALDDLDNRVIEVAKNTTEKIPEIIETQETAKKQIEEIKNISKSFEETVSKIETTVSSKAEEIDALESEIRANLSTIDNRISDVTGKTERIVEDAKVEIAETKDRAIQKFEESADAYMLTIKPQFDKEITKAKEYSESAKESLNEITEKEVVLNEKVEESLENVNAAKDKAILAESYAHGGTGVRGNEDEDNAMFYMEQAKNMTQKTLVSVEPLVNDGTHIADISVDGVITEIYSKDTASKKVRYLPPVEDDGTVSYVLLHEVTEV